MILIFFVVCSDTVFCCRQCYKIFGDRQELVSHQRDNNHRNDANETYGNFDEIRLFKCDYEQCNEVFYHQWRLNKHKKLHLRPYPCTYNGCNKSFGDRRNLLIHSRIHNKERSEKCRFCDKSFKDPSTLRHHIGYIHNNGSQQKPFVCRKCHKSFNKKSCLRGHLLTHLPRNDRQLFVCQFNDKCNASFTIKSNLNRHLRKIHGCLNEID